MITFLPYPSYNKSAEVLDDRRLGKQRVEALQITYALLGIGPDFEPRESNSYRNHPAVRMWWGNCRSLISYGMVVCLQWRAARKFDDSCLESFVNLQDNLRWLDCDYPIERDRVTKPIWIGDNRLHLAHQSNLVRKDPEHYRKFFPEVSDNLEYWWPA